MDSYIVRQQVREINRKLFANDVIYSDDSFDTLEQIIASIVQKYNPEDELAGVPTILELKEKSFDKGIVEKILLMNTDSVIIQINNRLLSEANVVETIKKLKESGYRIVVDINKEDTVFTLAKIFADIIKFNISNIPTELLKAENNFNCKRLAYNVNTPEDYLLAEQSNIDYYEGNYISPATHVEINSSQHSSVNFIEIIAKINEESSNVHDIAKIIARDSLMTAQIIRLSNSIYFGSKYRIDSIDDAVVRVGMNNLKRWIFLLQFSSNNNVPEELIQTSYHRAIFCESIIKESKIVGITPNEAYMIGLFSTLDILTGRPMDTELSKMHLNSVVEDALIYRDGIGGTLINLIRAYEDANWKRVDKYIVAFKIDKDRIYDLYYTSINEVTKLWRSLTEHGDVK